MCGYIMLVQYSEMILPISSGKANGTQGYEDQVDQSPSFWNKGKYNQETNGTLLLYACIEYYRF